MNRNKKKWVFKRNCPIWLKQFILGHPHMSVVVLVYPSCVDRGNELSFFLPLDVSINGSSSNIITIIITTITNITAVITTTVLNLKKKKLRHFINGRWYNQYGFFQSSLDFWYVPWKCFLVEFFVCIWWLCFYFLLQESHYSIIQIKMKL